MQKIMYDANKLAIFMGELKKEEGSKTLLKHSFIKILGAKTNLI